MVNILETSDQAMQLIKHKYVYSITLTKYFLLFYWLSQMTDLKIEFKIVHLLLFLLFVQHYVSSCII
jgi:hypothetical protein